MSNMQTAQTILEQLGGRRFSMMTGARDFVALESGVRFRLPRTSNFCKDGINLVSVVLTDRDDYDVTFAKVRGTKHTVVSTSEGVYADNLRDVFTSATGLETSLGTLGR